jgi:hypothetical protein
MKMVSSEQLSVIASAPNQKRAEGIPSKKHSMMKIVSSEQPSEIAITQLPYYVTIHGLVWSAQLVECWPLD